MNGELDCKEGWVPKNWCFQTMALEKTLESPLGSKEIKPVHPKGNQSWIFIGRTDAEAPVFWPSDTKSQLIRKDPEAGKDWWQEEKGATEDEMAGWRHRLDGDEFRQTPGDGEGQGSLASLGLQRRTWLSDWTTATPLVQAEETELRVWCWCWSRQDVNFRLLTVLPGFLAWFLPVIRSRTREHTLSSRGATFPVTWQGAPGWVPSCPCRPQLLFVAFENNFIDKIN